MRGDGEPGIPGAKGETATGAAVTIGAEGAGGGGGGGGMMGAAAMGGEDTGTPGVAVAIGGRGGWAMGGAP